MIKKDIVYLDKNIDPKKEASDQEIDNIFSNADMEMENLEKKYLVKKKDRNILKSLKRTLIIVGIAIVVGFIILGISLVYAVKSQLPKIKSSIVEQVAEARNELIKKEDEELTLEEYYQKQVFLLITPEDMASVLDEFTSKDMLKTLFTSEGTIDIDLIPEDKRDEYNKLMEEYEKAKETGVIPGLEAETTEENTSNQDANKNIENTEDSSFEQ